MNRQHPPNRIAVIARKEFREIFRDRRAIMSILVGPLLITPVLFAIIGLLVGGQIKKSQARAYPVAVAADARSQQVARTIIAAAKEGGSNLVLRLVRPDEAESSVESRSVSAAVLLPINADGLYRYNLPMPVSLFTDQGDETSQAVGMRLNVLLERASKRLMARRLASRGLPPGFATTFSVTDAPVTRGGNLATLLLGQLLPYILILSSFTGGIFAAFDQVAGEKERGTLETLLVSRASRAEIVMGKFGAVVSVCVVNSLLSVVGFILPFYLGGSAFAWLSRGGIHISPSAVAVTLCALLPISIFFAGALLAVSTFARNQKEAQTYLAPLLPLVLLPSIFSVFIGPDPGKAVALIPLLGPAVLIRQAIANAYDPLFLVLAVGSSALYACAALVLATYLFTRESVLLKS